MALTQGNTVLVWNFQGITIPASGRSNTGLCIPALVQNVRADGVTIDAVCFLPSGAEPQVVYGISPTSSITTGTPVSYTLI